MESEIWQFVKDQYPGQVQVLGPDVMSSGANGGTLAQFRINAGNPTFPLLRDCADGSALSDTNLLQPYTQRDNYVVINKQGIIRYNADDAWDYGNRYHANEILGVVDSLVIHGADAGAPGVPGWTLSASPNPARGRVTLALANPTSARVRARLAVLDVSGRRLVDRPEELAPNGITRVFWDGRDARGRRLPAGLYLVRADLPGRRLLRRVVLAR